MSILQGFRHERQDRHHAQAHAWRQSPCFGRQARSRLDWRSRLHWLLEDGLIDQEQVLRTEARFAAGDSALHPLVRLGHANLVRPANGKPLDVDALTEWLASRARLLTCASTR